MDNATYQFYGFLLRPHLIYMILIYAYFILIMQLNYAEDKLFIKTFNIKLISDT
jgi:hypothetical protein